VLWAVCLSSVVGNLSGAPETPVQERYEYSRFLMGTLFRIVVYSSSEERARQGSEAAFRRVEQLNQILSDWEKDSELNLLVRSASRVPQPVSPELMEVLEASFRLSELSEGAFDITSGPPVALWRRARQTGSLPSQPDIEAALSRVGYRRVILDRDAGTVSLASRGMQIDLGGIAKGYAVDQALKTLGENDLDRAMVDGGGDIVVSGAPPNRETWRVEIRKVNGLDWSFLPIEIVNAAIATSGDVHQSFEIEGQRYSHIVDPRTGQATTSSVQVTVMAPTAMQADGLATALSVLTPGQGVELVESLSQTCARIVQRSEKGLEVFSSSCFPK
jgi:thiamine biosynthesis lipoprotein